MATESLYRNRRIVYTGLIVFATLAAIDALPQYTVLHGKLKRWVDPILDVTGLWQGSWALFAPTPDHVNVRIGATLEGANGHRVVWSQPDWNAMTPWTKMRMFRQMSYYDNIWRGENSAAWPALIEWLVLHHGDGQTQFDNVVLFQQRDVISPPGSEFRPAYSTPDFQEPTELMTWTRHE